MTIQADLQSLSPTALLTFYSLDYTNLPGGAVLNFHAGTNGLSQPIVWQGVTYTPFPVEAEGFDVTAKGTMPRPKLRVSNINGVLSYTVKQFDDFVGAKVTRKRTFLKYLDAVNFSARRNLLLRSETLNVSPWAGSGVTASSAGDFYDGTIPFWTLAKSSTATGAAYVQSFGAVSANTPRTATIALKAGTTTSVSVGLFGSVGGWGLPANTSAEIISGPGTLANQSGALWTVTNLSGTVPTLLRVTRTYVSAETSTGTNIFIYPGTSASNVLGASVKATRVQVENGLAATSYESVGSVWSGNSTADPNQYLPDDLWFVERKMAENRQVIEFELSSAFDLMGQQLPNRQIIQNSCPWKYRGTECGWTGANFDINNAPSTLANDMCAKTLTACRTRFADASQPVRFGGFPGAVRGAA